MATKVRFYDFIPTKDEELNREASFSFPLQPLRWHIADVHGNSPILMDLLCPWEFKKVLEATDVGQLGGIILFRDERINRNWNFDWKDIKRGDTVRVTVRDVDTRGDYGVYMYVNDDHILMHNNWMTDFVFRRGLKAGDTIGMYWNRTSKMICFSVLKRASDASWG